MKQGINLHPLALLKFALRRLTERYFTLFERLGFHILPVHYYSPIPEVGKLRDDIWQRHSELIGIKINEGYQLRLLQDFSALYSDEFNNLPLNKTSETRYYVYNGSFESVDGEIYYCMIRHFKPKKVIEVGAGFSTLLAAEAISKNREEGYDCELIAVDPYSMEFLRKVPGLRLIEKGAEEVELSEFTNLNENDILFIDSTHVVRIGGEVVYLYLEVLPRLKRGVLIHFHDIFLPLEYPKDWVLKQHRFWNEQYLLQAFLMFNDSFEVVWAGSYMNLKHPDKLEATFRSYRRGQTFPGSFWIRRIR
ncbi:MAG: class I SAM-dependent methyltransferase [Candidatus Bathyarchaeia archaeon]